MATLPAGMDVDEFVPVEQRRANIKSGTLNRSGTATRANEAAAARAERRRAARTQLTAATRPTARPTVRLNKDGTPRKKRAKKIKKKTRRGRTKWNQALMIMNRGLDAFCIPKKGTPDYEKVKQIMATL
jgi:hypothetical protein